MQSLTADLSRETSTAHLIVTDAGDDGWTLESPQLPGFLYARSNLIDFRADMGAVLTDVGVVAAQAVFHDQMPFETPEGVEYIVRVRQDSSRGERIALGEQVKSILVGPDRFGVLETVPPGPTGERLFICSRSTDLVRDVTEQVYEGRDVVAIALARLPQVWIGPLISMSGELDPRTRTLETLGLGPDSTLFELAERVGVGADRLVAV